MWFSIRTLQTKDREKDDFSRKGQELRRISSHAVLHAEEKAIAYDACIPNTSMAEMTDDAGHERRITQSAHDCQQERGYEVVNMVRYHSLSMANAVNWR